MVILSYNSTSMRTKRIVNGALLALLIAGIVGIAIGGIFLWLQYKKGQQAEPTPEPAPLNTYISEKMARMSLREKVASLFLFHTATTEAKAITSYMQTYQPGGLIFMGDNIPPSINDLPSLTAATVTDDKMPPFAAVDEEGDTVKRLPTDTFAGPQTLRNEPPEATKQAFAQRSQLLKQNGFNLNFGIIADTTNDADSFIYPRVLGTSPQAAAERVKAAVEGSAGITLSTLKHFPGHGETTADSHHSIPTATTGYDDWKNRVALPFQAGIDAGADLLMFGHLRYSKVDSTPATLSKKWHDIARNDLGFEGIIVTDDMFMLQQSGDEAYQDPVKNAVSALKAGSELLLYVTDNGAGTTIDPNQLIDGVTQAAERGEIDKSQLDETVKKLLTIRNNLQS